MERKAHPDHWERSRIWLTALPILLTVMVLPRLTKAQSEALTEYQVKAAFLVNFAKFVEWPSDTFADQKAPVALCVYGDDPFGDALDNAVRGQSIGARAFIVRRTTKLPSLKACQVVFVSNSESNHLQDILPTLSGSNVLTVGDSSHFAEQGGEIQFVMEGNRERFAINVDSINRARLKLSSKLLALATIVHDTTPEKAH